MECCCVVAGEGGIREQTEKAVQARNEQFFVNLVPQLRTAILRCTFGRFSPTKNNDIFTYAIAHHANNVFNSLVTGAWEDIADNHFKDKDRILSLIEVALTWGNARVIPYLEEKLGTPLNALRFGKYSKSAFHLISASGNVEGFKFIGGLPTMQDISLFYDANESTPLSDAVKEGRLEMVKYLIEICQFSPIKTNKEGESAYILAKKKTGIFSKDEHKQVFSYLSSWRARYKGIFAFIHGKYDTNSIVYTLPNEVIEEIVNLVPR